MKIAPLMTGLALIGLSACNNADKTSGAVAARSIFFDKTGMDTSVKPGDNFFDYANGKWIKTAVIPDDQSGTGSFNTLAQENLKALKAILEEASTTKHSNGTPEQKVGDYYASGMDTAAIEKIGNKPLLPMLARIDSVKDYKQLISIIAELNTSEESDLFGMYVAADDKNSSKNIVVLSQAGISLPERDYYFRKDSAANAARVGLVKFANTLFTLTGADTASASKQAQQILALETTIATAHKTAVELRDPQTNYHKMSLTQLEASSPNMGWKDIFTMMKVKTDSANVAQPAYFKALSELIKSQPLDVWKAKIKFDYINSDAGLLCKSFTDARFDFARIFSGRKKQSDRWKQMVNAVDGNLDDLLGQIYVKKHFTPEAKQRIDELVNNLQKAFKTRIDKLDWMTDSTKQKAIVKLNGFLKKVGYPEKWKNYDDVVVDRNNYFNNAKSGRLHRYNETIAKVDKPVDRTEWTLSVPTVNAYYNPSNNEIVFPAGILQFPFFDPNADDAVNYGGIGMVIGHEMTHGFDDQGSQYDAEGNLKNWWAAADAEKFKSKTGGVVKQYSAYTLFDSLHINGALTLGENLADIGGLAIAYDAFKLTKQGQGNELLDGLTPDQRFFLGYAQVWRLKDRDETVRAQLATDPHSPEQFRVNGPAANFDPFYKAFDVKEGEKLYIKPEDRARIW